MGQNCCAQHTFDTHELDNLARTRYMKTHPNCEIENELTSLSSELLQIAMRKTLLRKRKLILITSATSPIGKALCCEFASKSSEYIICGISSNTKHIKQMTDDLDKISSTIKSLSFYDEDNEDNDEDDSSDNTYSESLSNELDLNLNDNDTGTLTNIQCVDVCNEKKMALWIMDIFEEYGIPDLIINNSTIIDDNPDGSLSYSQFVAISDRNVTAYFHLLKYLMPSLIKRRYGIIVNLTGTSQSIPNVFKTAYNSSKYAMEGYVESLAHKLLVNNKIHSKNISFITMSIGSLDMKSLRILCKDNNKYNNNSLKEGLLKNSKRRQKEEGVTFQRWASKSVPIIVSLLNNINERNKNKIYTNNKYNQYTNVDRIVDLNTMLTASKQSKSCARISTT